MHTKVSTQHFRVHCISLLTTGSVTDLLLSCVLAAAKEISFFLSWLPKVHMGYHDGNREYEFHDITYDLPGGAGCMSAYH